MILYPLKWSFLPPANWPLTLHFLLPFMCMYMLWIIYLYSTFFVVAFRRSFEYIFVYFFALYFQTFFFWLSSRTHTQTHKCFVSRYVIQMKQILLDTKKQYKLTAWPAISMIFMCCMSIVCVRAFSPSYHVMFNNISHPRQMRKLVEGLHLI